MGTKTIHVSVTEQAHSDLSDRKGEATWREVIEAGVDAIEAAREDDDDTAEGSE